MMGDDDNEIKVADEDIADMQIKEVGDDDIVDVDLEEEISGSDAAFGKAFPKEDEELLDDPEKDPELEQYMFNGLYE